MKQQLRIIKRLIALFVIIILLSGLTAIPIAPELNALLGLLARGSDVHEWLKRVLSGYTEVKERYPYLLYGYDWLAFAHFILAILFMGAYRDPVKNVWIIEFGMISCMLVIPLAGIAGYFRHIPAGWQLVDCSFGVFGYIPLKIIHNKITVLSNALNNKTYL